MKKIFIPSPGVTFLIPSEKGRHLHFVLTPPVGKGDSKEVLIVGITSAEIDPEFALDRGDHPFIKHKSYLNYPMARIIFVKDIEKNLNASEMDERFLLRETADELVIRYIVQGLLESRHSIPVHRRFYEKAVK